MPEPLDDRTVSYVLATERAFDDLRQVASQLAGLLVLAASGAKSATPDHPMMEAARSLCDEAGDAVRHAHPTDRALPHHRHVLQAAAAIGLALAEAREHFGNGRPSDIDSILTPLRVGYEHLRRASDLLPGFELIGFGQACCSGAHEGGMGRAGRMGGIERFPSSPSRPSSPSSQRWLP